ncbi:DUF6894 family protein [Microvirga sp. GCM10011540]|uniref:DUF6894 family protein n=1 Tax=Microvirga sp. GCM10011540 TaxID=3317338 RepID=UPI00361D63EC
MLEPEPLISAKFFFHLVSDAETIRDEDGVCLSLHEGELLCAVRAIAELRQEGFFAARAWQDWRMDIADSAGRVILSVPLGGCDVSHSQFALH